MCLQEYDTKTFILLYIHLLNSIYFKVFALVAGTSPIRKMLVPEGTPQA
jgi:hypothetical protein